MRRISPDAVIALVLLGAGGFVLNNLLRTEGSGAYVKTTTLPIALVITLMLLATLLLAQSLLRSQPADDTTTGDPAGTAAVDIRALARVAGLLLWIVLYVAALPWFGYLASSIVFLAGANLIYGNRNPVSVVAISVVVPVCLLLFFERFMIVLLPSARLFG